MDQGPLCGGPKEVFTMKEEYENFLTKNKFDLDKIRILTSIIFLNMSPLHKEPFSHMLYFLGKSMLYKSLNKSSGEKNG